MAGVVTPAGTMKSPITEFRSSSTIPSSGAASSSKPTTREIVELYRELKTFYQHWHNQQMQDDNFYNLLYEVAMSENPHNFEAVRPPSATTIVDMAADHSAGNFPRLHIPKRRETSKDSDRALLMQKAGQGFWYRTIATQSQNIFRAWAQSGALRGAIAGELLFNRDVWPAKPLPSKYGGIDSEAYKDAVDAVDAERRDCWPFVLQPLDPIDLYPDPSSEGRDFMIHAFERKAYEVKRAWPNWNWTVPGTSQTLKPTDNVTFIAYADKYYRAYMVGGAAGIAQGQALPLNEQQDGVQKHGYGFNPMMFVAGGFGSPFGLPQFRYRGILTNARDLLKLEARRMTHLDAIVAQQSFPWLIAQQGVNPDMQLGGITRVPAGTNVRDAIIELRPQVPINEIVMELHETRQALQRATIPDALGGLEGKSGESGYLRSLNVGTGRARIRGLSDALERMVEASTTGFFKLVENKVKAPVAIWGKGMDSEQEFVTIKPEDIGGHYEVYASLTPSLPQDDTMNIRNGQVLYEHGGIPMRDMLQTYAGRENATDLMQERMAEDLLKSVPMQQQMVADVMQVTRVTAGPMATPGFTQGIEGLPPQMMPATANPQSNAGTGIPTPPAAPGSFQQANAVIAQAENAGAPTHPGALQGIARR